MGALSNRPGGYTFRTPLTSYPPSKLGCDLICKSIVTEYKITVCDFTYFINYPWLQLIPEQFFISMLPMGCCFAKELGDRPRLTVLKTTVKRGLSPNSLILAWSGTPAITIRGRLGMIVAQSLG
ncbi:hypothetical protein [Desulfogranum marinum]|uniref:hypothetical protein n=1 Tax=Desulfogranum marinum TaxID=453220 RepID=UPI0029C768C5|nr:hypothetical protein [Desulfogranum marinum]